MRTAGPRLGNSAIHDEECADGLNFLSALRLADRKACREPQGCPFCRKELQRFVLVEVVFGLGATKIHYLRQQIGEAAKNDWPSAAVPITRAG